MPKVHFVKKARNDVPGTDIKAGESYYWWKFRYGGKHASRKPPKPRQLTQSSFRQQLYDIQDMISNATADESIRDTRDDVVSALTDLMVECQGNLDNMPEGLQQGDTGQLLQERIDALESAISEFEDLELDDPGEDEFADEVPERVEGESDEEFEERKKEALEMAAEGYWEEKLTEFQSISIDAV